MANPSTDVLRRLMQYGYSATQIAQMSEATAQAAYLATYRTPTNSNSSTAPWANPNYGGGAGNAPSGGTPNYGLSPVSPWANYRPTVTQPWQSGGGSAETTMQHFLNNIGATNASGTYAPPATTPSASGGQTATQYVGGGQPSGGGGGGGGGGTVGGGGPSGQASDVYGGYEWKRLELEAMIAAAQQTYQYWLARGSDTNTARQFALEAAQQRMDADLATGYVRQGGYTPNMAYGGYSTGAGYSGYANPQPAATTAVAKDAVVSDNPARADALTAIYNNRTDANGNNDIKALYDANPEWANKSVVERMENWLGMTTETDYKGKTDAELIEKAKSKGWLVTQAEKNAGTVTTGGAGTTGANPWYPTFYDENNPPTEDAALQAVWNNDYAARDKYNKLHPNDWRAAMAAWKADNNITDAVAYAKGKGWLQVAGPLQKTLARENAEHSWEDADLDRARQEQSDKNNFVMQYLNNRSAKKGPEDWVSYWKYQRGVIDNTEVPTWLTAAQQQYNLPSWGVNAGQAGIQSGVQGQGQQAYGAGQAQGQSLPAWGQNVGANAQGGYSNETIQNWQNSLATLKPWQMSSQAWNQMLPSEQKAMLGGIDSSGGSGEDFYAMMQRAAPRGQTTAYTSWR